VFVSGSSTILFSGNVLVCIFVSGSSGRGVKEVILRMEIRENPEEMGWKQ
jgi:hypothetical protein